MAPGVGLCCALAVLGDFVAQAGGLPIPGAILGFAAYLALLLNGRAIAWSRPGAALLIRWIGAMIVPALVGLGSYAMLLGGVLVPLVGLLVATTMVTALATAAIYRLAGGRD
jgi:holin-like protein